MTLAEYMRRFHPGPKQFRASHPSDFQPRFKKVPVKTITMIKVVVLVGIVLAVMLPPQYAVWVVLFTNGYWMFKL